MYASLGLNELSQVLSREWRWRCSWSSANRRCSKYIWVIIKFIAWCSVPYIRDLTVLIFSRVTSLALKQSYDCPSASEATLKGMGKLITWICLEWWYNLNKIICISCRRHISDDTFSWSSFPYKWYLLTHLPLVSHICINELGQH